eukprot:1429720-Pleurochrysis_carterae.AAC.1
MHRTSQFRLESAYQTPRIGLVKSKRVSIRLSLLNMWLPYHSSLITAAALHAGFSPPDRGRRLAHLGPQHARGTAGD